MSTTAQPTFTLYRGWDTPNEIVWSPFVTKVEFRLRHSGVDYNSQGGSAAQSPKGKIPYINVNYGNESNDTFSDSTLILQRLVKEGHIQNLNANLSEEQTLQDLAIRSLLEEKLYFYHMHERWIGNYYAHRDHILAHMGMPKRAIVGLLIYRTIKATLHGQGTGRLTDDEIETYRYEIWQTIEDQLAAVKRKTTTTGSQPFWILGLAEPTEADATLFGFAASVLVAGSCPRSQEVVRGMPAVMDYTQRIFEKYFQGFQSWILT